MLFIGLFIISDELLRVAAVFGFPLSASFIPVATLIAANFALSGCFSWIFTKHSSHRLGYFLVYTLILPLSSVLGLFALLLHEPNGNFFFVEYFCRLCLNITVFSISCREEIIESPQHAVFTILLWVNVICFIWMMATLSNKILQNSAVHRNVLSLHEINPRLGHLHLEGMAPRVSENNPIYDDYSVNQTPAIDRTEDETADIVLSDSVHDEKTQTHPNLQTLIEIQNTVLQI
jgi:hypothetical protein